MRVLGTLFAALAGLAFGSFLNVCITRWSADESVLRPRSHCRSCGRTLTWWENVPVVSWLALRGRCRTCKARIGWRHPLVEVLVGGTWAVAGWHAMPALYLPGWSGVSIFDALFFASEQMILCWLLIGLAVLDAEHLWLPDRLTLGGAVIGLPFTAARFTVHWIWVWIPWHWAAPTELVNHRTYVYTIAELWLIGVLAAPGMILLTRWAYQRVRSREGMGLGDAKLMLLLAVWLGLSYTLLAFLLGVVIGAVAALVVLATRRSGHERGEWAIARLPLGTFLCVGGMVSALWGRPMIAAYLRWCNFY